MMLRPVHVTERQAHHILHNLNRILRKTCHTEGNDGIQPGHMAVIADIMAVYTTRLASFLFVADGTFHFFICLQIDKRSFTDQAFVIHPDIPFSFVKTGTRMGACLFIMNSSEFIHIQ